MIPLNGREIMGLHLLLKDREMELDETMQGLLFKTEKLLYERLSVEELENLSQLYGEKLDILKERG